MTLPERSAVSFLGRVKTLPYAMRTSTTARQIGICVTAQGSRNALALRLVFRYSADRAGVWLFFPFFKNAVLHAQSVLYIINIPYYGMNVNSTHCGQMCAK